MSLFGNSTFSTIFYIFSIVVTFCITIKLRERLNLYIENIPEKERSFCEKFLSNQVIQIILFAGLGFVLLKFIVDPAMVILFPASITIPTIIGGAYDEDDVIEIEPIVYDSDKQNEKQTQIGGLNDQEEEEPVIDVDALIEQNAAKVQDTEDQQAELINQLQTLQTKLVEQQKQQQELVQQQQKQQQELIQQQTNQQQTNQTVQQQVQQQNQQQTNQQQTNQTVQQQVQQQNQQQTNQQQTNQTVQQPVQQQNQQQTNQQQTNQTVQQPVQQQVQQQNQQQTNQQPVQQGGEDTTQQNQQQTNQTVQQQVQQQNQQQTNQTVQQQVQQQNKQQTNQTVQQQVQQQNKQQTNQTVEQQNQQQTNQQKQQQQENYPEKVLPSKAELPVDEPVIDTLVGGKKMGRPRKIKSLAKQELGKKNVWAQAVKQAREALGIQGFQPVKKGGLLYKTAQAYYTTLKN
jgi:hypothetical protein